MINEFINDIKQMKEQLSEDSCLKKEPFIKLGTGQAPVLNYNIPQSACFNTYGHQFVKGVSQEVFLPQTKVAPPQNYFEVVQQTPEPVLRQRFAEAVQLQRTDDMDLAILVSCYFWKETNLNKYADKDDLFNISKLVNLPTAKKSTQINGYSDREKYLEKFKSAFNQHKCK